MTDAEYIARIHNLPCCICQAFGEVQTSPTQAHHTICGRYSQKRTPDKQAIPLCEGHHTGLMDTSKLAIHKAKKTWVNKYGADTDYIAATQDAILGKETK
jgi:hypothetical protein